MQANRSAGVIGKHAIDESDRASTSEFDVVLDDLVPLQVTARSSPPRRE